MRQIKNVGQNHVWKTDSPPPLGKQDMVRTTVLLTWQDGPVGSSAWRSNRKWDEGLLGHSPKAVNTNRGDGKASETQSIQYLLLLSLEELSK